MKSLTAIILKQGLFCKTESGVIQEEGTSYGVPVLVMRDTTERTEGVEAGILRLVCIVRGSRMCWSLESVMSGLQDSIL